MSVKFTPPNARIGSGASNERLGPSAVLSTGIRLLVTVSFLISGFTGLVYETIWTRLMVRVVGASPLAVSLVLTVFMAGLGLGSWLAGRWIHKIPRHRHILAGYGILELGIGLCGLVLPLLIDLTLPVFSLMYNQLYETYWLYNVLLLFMVMLLFLLPATLMGATLPLLGRFYTLRLNHLGRRLGRLYALNTIGAALGSLAAGFWLINRLGVDGALYAATILNVLIGFACIYAGLRWKVVDRAPGSGSADVHGETDPLLPNRPNPAFIRNATLLVFALSGFCAMAYEVIWTRLIELLIGPTVYSLSIVLAAFIGGLAIGSWVFGKLADRMGSPVWWLILTQLAAAVLALLTSQLLGNSQLFFAKLIHTFKDNFGLLSLLEVVILWTMMLPCTLFLGAAFPLATKIYTQSTRQLGRSVGFAYAVNTIGALSGSFLAGFLFIPVFGKESSLSLLAGIQLLGPLLLLVVLRRRSHPESRSTWVTAGFALLALALCFALPQWNRQTIVRGMYHRLDSYERLLEGTGWLRSLVDDSILRPYGSDYRLVYYGDGIGGFTTVVEEMNTLGEFDYYLSNSGKVEASSRGDLATQAMITHIPMLFHSNPKDVMVLGLASGMTAGEVLRYPVSHLDVLEISEQVVAASDFFKPWNNHVLEDPRTNLILQDGRAHLALTDRSYDVIISEPSNPWMAGLASLFSVEYYEVARARLNPGGIFMQWIHTYQMDWETFALMGRSFTEHFPDGMMMHVSRSSTDILLVGFRDGRGPIFENAEAKLPELDPHALVRIPDVRVLADLVVTEDLEVMFGKGPLHSDRHPRLEFQAPMSIHWDDPLIQQRIGSNRRIDEAIRSMQRDMRTVEGQLWFAEYALSANVPHRDLVDLSQASPLQREKYFELMEDYCSKFDLQDLKLIQSPPELLQRCLLARLETLNRNLDSVAQKGRVFNYIAESHSLLGDQAGRIDYLLMAVEAAPRNADLHNNLGIAYMDAGMLSAAISEYLLALNLNSDLVEARNNLGLAYYYIGSLDLALEQFREAVRIDPDSYIPYMNIGRAYFKKGLLTEAAEALEVSITINPRVPESHLFLAKVHAARGDHSSAIAELRQTIELQPDQGEAFIYLGSSYFALGRFEDARDSFRRALELQANDPGVLYNLARVNWELKEAGLALQYLEKAVSMGYPPDIPFLRDLREAANE